MREQLVNETRALIVAHGSLHRYQALERALAGPEAWLIPHLHSTLNQLYGLDGMATGENPLYPQLKKVNDLMLEYVEANR